jgi:hypothetical protein
MAMKKEIYFFPLLGLTQRPIIPSNLEVGIIAPPLASPDLYLLF